MAAERKLPRELLRGAAPGKASPLRQAVRAAQGALLSPAFWLLSHRWRVPGLDLWPPIARIGFRALRSGRRLPASLLYSFFFWPMDSTRYFELPSVLDEVTLSENGSYLDVSSPRLLPFLVLDRHRAVRADLINPDADDLATTRALAEALGVADRCRFHGDTIEGAELPVEGFDLVTSVSVVEHIPDERPAIARMWSVVKPGGRLLLTVPCAAEAREQYIDRNPFGGLREEDERGGFFWQRFYDGRTLAERILATTGAPAKISIYGEKRRGCFARDACRKRSDPWYPFWREPYQMGRDYRLFSSIADLPGEGVVSLSFHKL